MGLLHTLRFYASIDLVLAIWNFDNRFPLCGLFLVHVADQGDGGGGGGARGAIQNTQY